MKLIINHLTKSFEEKVVLNDINFTFKQGKIYGLLGRNGSGKTTFFNCLDQDIPFAEGTFDLIKDNETNTLQLTDIGYVLSTPNVPEFLTAREFLKFFLDINEDKLKEKKTIDEYFDFIHIAEEDRDKLLKDYSYGMKNKMQMLVNIIANPNVLLLDEPLTSLDVVVAEEMKEMLKSIKKDHIIIFSTHIMELALSLCDEIVILNNGKLEEIDRKNLTDQAMKDKIIKALTEEK
ncbi:MAG TPA: ABC transporter ATP-binding protein [Candidatus Onthousia faecavium]|nr:ABC transporter ATP-binding protein [Candidatus Onthousia faecavium]